MGNREKSKWLGLELNQGQFTQKAWVIQRTVRSIGFNVPLALFDRVLCRVGFSESRANSQLLVTFPNVWDPDIQRISINDNVIFYQSPFTFKN